MENKKFFNVMASFRSIKKSAFMVIGALLFASVSCIAQSPDSVVVDPTILNPTDPGSIVSPVFVHALQGAAVLILTFLSGLIPGIKKIPYKFFRAVIIAAVTGVGFKMYGTAMINEQTFNFLIDGFLPGLSGGILSWETLKFVFGLIGIDLKAKAPTIPAK